MTADVGPDPFRVHGGRVEAARAVFGDGDWIDLSTGIAPWPYPVSAGASDRLPDPASLSALEAAAGRAFGVPAGRRVVTVPGSDLALRLLAIVLPADRPAVVVPGYAGHRAAWPGATRIAIDTLEDGDHDLIVLASPGNPDGCLLDRSRATALASRITLVVDEAYADPDPGLGSIDGEGLVLLRSFGKFYGLPGLRLGFVIASPDVAERMRGLLGDWPLSSAAIATGLAAYRDADFRDGQAGRIEAMGRMLDHALAHTGMPIMGSAPLFRLIGCADADALFRFLAARAILTRPFAEANDRLRIGLPADTRAAARLLAALQEFRR